MQELSAALADRIKKKKRWELKQIKVELQNTGALFPRTLQDFHSQNRKKSVKTVSYPHMTGGKTSFINEKPCFVFFPPYSVIKGVLTAAE